MPQSRAHYKQCGDALHEALYDNIVLTGGNSTTPGLAQQLYDEVSAAAPPRARVRLTQAVPRRRAPLAIRCSSVPRLSPHCLPIRTQMVRVGGPLGCSKRSIKIRVQGPTCAHRRARGDPAWGFFLLVTPDAFKKEPPAKA